MPLNRNIFDNWCTVACNERILKVQNMQAHIHKATNANIKQKFT